MPSSAPRQVPGQPSNPALQPQAWRLRVLLLLLLAIAGPFAFGLPVAGWQSAVDSNFALSLVRGYMHSLQAGVWLPRWLPQANSGLGSPVLYFYGRLPFLVAAAAGLLLHLSAPGALIAGFFIFRVAAYFSCRHWLRRHVEPRAAECGALTFIVLPFAMVFNPLTRTALAETAATALLPLIFLALDQARPTRRARALALVWLGILFAATAWMHPLHLLLGFAVTLLYASLIRGFAGILVNFLGFLLGLLLSAASFLPAVAMLPWVSPAGWTTGIPGLLLNNNFLFSAARYNVYRIHDIDLLLYSTWFICAVILLQAVRVARRQPQPALHHAPVSRRHFARALLLCLLFCLLAMTILAKPFWLLTPRLQLFQFPWRLFPAGIALAAALVAVWLTRESGAQRLCIRLLFCLAGVQLILPVTGAWLSFSGIQKHRRLSDSVLHRFPAYVPFAQRDRPPNNLENSVEPEYLPVTAHQAGWVPGPYKAYMLPGLQAFGVSPASSPGLQLAGHPDGSFTVQGVASASADVILPVFYFPDERITGAPDSSLSLDGRTGLARLHLVPGVVAVTLRHDRPLRILRLAHALVWLGVALTMGLLAFAAKSGKPFRPAVGAAPAHPVLTAGI